MIRKTIRNCEYYMIKPQAIVSIRLPSQIISVTMKINHQIFEEDVPTTLRQTYKT